MPWPRRCLLTLALPKVQGRTLVQVFQTDTGSPVWTRSLGFISRVTWSPDHGAVALSDEDSVQATDYRSL